MTDKEQAIKEELVAFLKECAQVDSGYFSKYMTHDIKDVIAWVEKARVRE